MACHITGRRSVCFVLLGPGGVKQVQCNSLLDVCVCVLCVLPLNLSQWPLQIRMFHFILQVLKCKLCGVKLY